jgi:hypothetical protein
MNLKTSNQKPSIRFVNAVADYEFTLASRLDTKGVFKSAQIIVGRHVDAGRNKWGNNPLFVADLNIIRAVVDADRINYVQG